MNQVLALELMTSMLIDLLMRICRCCCLYSLYVLVVNEVLSRLDERHKNHQILCVIV
jgi:hypothetical protein